MLLELNGLSAHFGKKQVLHQMSLSVGEGEVVALLGPNGAGKTTTLLTVSGMIPVLAGDVVVLGRWVVSLVGEDTAGIDAFAARLVDLGGVSISA